MRPLPGDDAWIGRQRPAADHESGPLLTSSASHSQMSFFVADEAAVDSYLDQPSIPRSRDSRKAPDDGHLPSSSRKHDKDKDKEPESSRHASRHYERDYGPAYSPMSRASVMTRSPASMVSHNQHSLSRPMSPIMLGTSCAASAMSSPSSRRNSLTGSFSEHAVSSEDEGPALRETLSSMMDSGSAPQLVMPSIKMPSRRPFTEPGKNMGRLKVLIAGDSGVGKTSLCKAIVQACEHIVHVDPIVSQGTSSRRSSKAGEKSFAHRRGSNSTTAITEIFASTKPYPEWWSELGEFRASQRRKSLGDVVLDRNICFVDTPGFASGSSVMETIVPCIEYVESHLNRVSSDSLSDPDMLNMLGGDGGFQVDVVLYLVHRSLKPADLEFLRRLAPLTNVIPLLAHADKLSAEELRISKMQIGSQLQDAGIQPFTFTTSFNQAPSAKSPTVPYAISSATGTDHDVMDASLLMSPEYVQPLIPSELSALVEQVFSPSGSSWLRHSAVKKYMQWRESSNPSRPKNLYRPLGYRPNTTFTLNEKTGALIGPPGCLALARTRNEYQDQNVGRLHVVDWAADLQRSLAVERAQYEELARGDRAIWLTEKLDECRRDGTLVSVNQQETGRRRRTKYSQSRKTVRHQDPLGLLQVAADLKAKGWYALEVLGGLGLIGGMAFLLARQQWRAEPVHIGYEWARTWAMDF